MDKNEHPQVATVIDAVKDFLRLESASGVLLVVATILAMIVANSPIQHMYDVLLDTPVEIRVGAFQIDKPLLLWVNDGLMALFFFLVGLELKREVTRGELSDPAKVTVPVMAAVGGMAVPAMIYSAINWGDAVAMQGWAIPSATDIAFAMGVLALLGDRVPSSLKLFLLTLAIVDDLGAIVIIALFYSHGLSWTALGTAAIALVVLWQMNRRGVIAIAPYMVIGLILWAAVLKSGVHATLAGVLVAAFIPLKKTDEEGCSPLERLEHDLHPTVAYLILPVFAFMNTGISLQGVTLASLFAPIPLGIAAGLFFGNQIGVMGMSYLAIKLRLGSLPEGANWTQLYGVSLLCGIGFTMSLFISSLAFEQGGQSSPLDDRLGILFGSLLAAFSGYAVLRLATRHKTGDEDSPAAD